ncbi:MAG: STAS domain-containing protein [Phycisphaerales bacterium]
MAEADELVVQTESTPDGVILRPQGDIDLSRSPSFRRRLNEAQTRKPGKLIVDLDEVPYMDSSGVATLVEAMQVARKQGHRLVLCNMQERVRSIFEIAKLETVFTIVDDVDKARTV